MPPTDNEQLNGGGEPSPPPPVPLTRALMEPRLSVLGRNPFTQAHVFTTATLANHQLLDLNVLNASHNQLAEMLERANPSALVDFDTPKCTPSNVWVGGGKWIGSLLRIANLSYNRIVRMRDLSQSHQFIQELHLAHNGILTIEGLAQLRFLRVLDLSHNRLTSTQGLLVAAVKESADNKRLEALETLILSHNQIEAVDEVASLPRLEHLDLSHNNMKQLSSIASCERLQQLDLSSNDLEDVNELNHLMPLHFLQRLALQGCPLIEREGSQVFYRARVLRRLLQLQHLDDDDVTAKEKVKALVMHGSDVEARQRVFAKYLPGQQFTNFLPPLEFEDEDELERFCEQLAEKQQLRGVEASAASAPEEANASSNY